MAETSAHFHSPHHGWPWWLAWAPSATGASLESILLAMMAIHYLGAGIIQSLFCGEMSKILSGRPTITAGAGVALLAANATGNSWLYHDRSLPWVSGLVAR